MSFTMSVPAAQFPSHGSIPTPKLLEASLPPVSHLHMNFARQQTKHNPTKSDKARYHTPAISRLVLGRRGGLRPNPQLHKFSSRGSGPEFSQIAGEIEGGDGEGGYLFVLEAGADVAELLVDAEALLLLVVAFLARIYAQGVDSK